MYWSWLTWLKAERLLRPNTENFTWRGASAAGRVTQETHCVIDPGTSCVTWSSRAHENQALAVTRCARQWPMVEAMDFIYDFIKLSSNFWHFVIFLVFAINFVSSWCFSLLLGKLALGIWVTTHLSPTIMESLSVLFVSRRKSWDRWSEWAKELDCWNWLITGW